MWAIAILIISLVGILSLVLLKSWERRSGKAPISYLRSCFDNELKIISDRLKLLPREAQGVLQGLSRYAVLRASSTLLRMLRFTEGKLIRVIHLVQGRGGVHRKRGSVSFFLQNVATYKEDSHGGADLR